MSDKIRVRFAPSPTGYLHVGGARTAIFNWLYARNVNGHFSLRIEDTDKGRSSEEMIREILDGLRWLGIDWDGEPVIQSKRVERHRNECLRLLDEGKAYWCYCSSNELAVRREASAGEGTEFRYDRACLHLSPQERETKEASGIPKVLRFHVPEGEVHFHDIVHEATMFQNSEIDDFIILRSDGSPVYMIAVVVDDHDASITHVLRGDDHLSNTPKQILLYEALGYETPMFGHVPLILGGDKKRLSKRHGATSVGEYQDRGYLPETLFNFLVLLGWSPGEDREIMTKEEMIEAFDLRRLLKKSSVFDEEKLRWMNGKRIREMQDEELLPRLRPYTPPKYNHIPDHVLRRIIPLMKERMFFLSDFFTSGKYFFEDPEVYDENGMAKHWRADTTAHLNSLVPVLETTVFLATDLEETIRAHAESLGIGAGKLIQPLRLALTGGTASPGMFELMEVLGKDVCVRRLKRSIAYRK